MSPPAVCEECGAGAHGQVPAYIIHKPGCSIGRERSQRVARRVLAEATRKQDKAERALEYARGVTTRAIREAAEVGVPKTELAEIAGVNRSRIYQVLGTG